MKIIGHRGANGLEPENTLRSFRKALEHHVDELEFDLRVTKDKVIVIHHNPAVVDPAGNALQIRTHAYRELQTHKPDLLTFSEFIEQIGNPVHLLIEIKPGEPTQPIIALLKKQFSAHWKPADISIASFDFQILQAMHRAFPEVEMVVNESWSGVRAAMRARKLGTKRLSMRSTWLYRGFLRSMQKRGYQISPYTVNDPAQAAKWHPYVYGIITDRPDLIKH